MLVNQTHIIRRQSLKVHATVHDALALKRKIALLMEELTPKLSALFDDLVPQNEWLQIDKLDIQIEGLYEHELDEKLQERILKSIQEKIGVSKYHSAVINDTDQPEYRINSVHAEGIYKERYKVISIYEKTVTALVYFLENGILPWWFEVGSHNIFEDQLSKAIDAYLEKKEDKSKDIILNLQSVLRNLVAQKRLVEQFNKDVYLKVIHLFSISISSNTFQDIEKAFKTVYEILSSHHTIPDLDLKQDEAILKQILSSSKKVLLNVLLTAKSTDEILRRWLQNIYYLLEIDSSPDESLKMVQKVFLDNTLIRKYFPAEFINNQSEPTRVNPSLNSPDTKEEEKRKETVVKIINKISIKELAKEDGVIISNAGLIIVAPFIPQLFSHCGVTKNNEITDYNRAIAILHYIAHGHCNYMEYDVLLNKILCGLDENAPIEFVEKLSESDKAAVDSMLTAVISHWSALKGTSPDGLREGFLIRKGSLAYKHGQWFLQAEQKTIDVLLDQLPWTIGYVKLSWMKTMLGTQWR